MHCEYIMCYEAMPTCNCNSINPKTSHLIDLGSATSSFLPGSLHNRDCKALSGFRLHPRERRCASMFVSIPYTRCTDIKHLGGIYREKSRVSSLALESFAPDVGEVMFRGYYAAV